MRYKLIARDKENKDEVLNRYERFVRDLAKNLKISPDVLLNGKVVENFVEHNTYNLNYNLYVAWEFEHRDFFENHLDRVGERYDKKY